MDVNNTTCKRCGKEFDSRFKKCPHCGEPNTYLFVVLKWLGITAASLIIVATLVLSILNTAKLGNIENMLNSAFSYSGDEASSEGIDIMQYDFYSPMEISGTELPKDEKYLLYFHQASCTYCHMANEYVLKYYSTTDDNGENPVSEAIPFYFVTPDSSSYLFDQFTVEGTPTLVIMENGKEVNRAEDYDSVVSMIKDTVMNYYNAN